MTQIAQSDRSILITGCASGIGLVAAQQLRARGWRVLATCRKSADCAKLRAEGFESFRLDYTDTASILAAWDEAMALTGGRLDALYNNGAYASPGAVEDLPTDAFRAIFEANFFGWHELTRLAVRQMRAQGPRGAGRIVNCSSVLGFAALKFRGAYQATKFALEGYTDTLRLELGETDIEVILIEPGPINTRIRENAYPPFKRWVRREGSSFEQIYHKVAERLAALEVKSTWELGPDAVAQKLIHALESDRPRARYYVTRPTFIAAYAKRILTTRGMDRLLERNSY
ncbi:MAG: SDR family NAD(P)-dependent oxidoreductase [Neomegalonema sp.]|nr:SDR family NAD(P)-dependent oxidoreductase [Neomegalonema sp.]